MIIHIGNKEIDYQPYKDELYLERMILRIRQKESLKLVFKRDITNKFFSILRGVTKVSTTGYNRNTVLSISGGTGDGKSSLSFSIGLNFFPNFSSRNVFFYDEQILAQAHTFKEHDLIVRDENPAKAVYGQGSNRTTGQFNLLAETCRKSSLNLALIEPSFQQNDITKYYMHTIDQDIKQRITRVGLMDGETLKFMGAVYIPIMPENHPEWQKYQNIKDTFIENMKKGDFTGSKLDYRALAEKTLADPDFIHYRNKTERKAYLIMKYPNYTTGEIEVILSLIKVKQREEKDVAIE